MDEKEHSLFTQKQELLKRRKQLLDIKFQLLKDVHINQPVKFGRKYGTLSEREALSIADRLPHKFPDVRFLQPLECHMLCGMKVINYDNFKLVVEFRPCYLEKILPEVYAIYLEGGINGYSVKKYYLPESVQMESVVQRWSPLKKDNLKSFLRDIKQQTNAFHHRQNQILELKDWASNQKIALKVFHPLSLLYIIITAKMDDNDKLRNYAALTLVFHYDSNSYLPTTVDIESSEMEEEDLAAAQEQFSAFKSYYLREAFQICTIKNERFSLSAKEGEPTGNFNEEDNGSILVSSDENTISDSSSTPVEQVNKENRLLPAVEEARMSKLKSSTKGRRNTKRDNNPTSDEDVDIAEVTTSDASEKIEQFQLQSKMKRGLKSVIQRTEKSKSRYSTKAARNLASKGKSNTVQTKKQLKTLRRTNRKAPKKINSPDDAPDDFLHTRKSKRLHDHSTNKITKEVPTLNQANKITRYMVKPK